jgi:hypothetical protein
MARSERITLRLSPEERALLEEEARKEDLQLTPWLRKKLGLSNRRPDDRRDFDKPENMLAVYEVLGKAAAKAREMEAEPERDERGPIERSMDDKAFKKKVAQIMGKTNCSQAEAEEKARA